MIEIDGGVTVENASDIMDAGADVLVAGNTVFKSADPKATIAQLKDDLLDFTAEIAEDGEIGQLQFQNCCDWPFSSINSYLVLNSLMKKLTARYF